MRLAESKRFRRAARFGVGDYLVVQLAMKSPCSDLAPLRRAATRVGDCPLLPSAVTFSRQLHLPAGDVRYTVHAQ